MDTAKIYIDGLERYITSYECLLFKEPGNLGLGSSSISPHQYLSCLFKNLGYDKCPRDFTWMEREIDILDVPKTEVLDYPITKNCLMLHKNSTLFNLLMCIRNWIKSEIERGRLPDPIKSFKPFTKEEIQYSIENRIKLTKKVEMRKESDTWSKSDIFWRRLYNLSPNVDPVYLECSLTNFETFSKQIEVIDPWSIFISALINPDILMSSIKQAEIEATNEVFDRHSASSKLTLNELEVAKEFKKILDRKFMIISTILRNGGPKAFSINNVAVSCPTQIPSMGSDISLIAPISLRDPEKLANQILLGEIFTQITNTPLDENLKSVVFKYVEPKSLLFLDRMGYDNVYRVATYKRLFYTIEQLRNRNPELLNPKERFVFSQSFYIDPDRFGLYSRIFNKVYVAGLDLILREMSPQEAVAYYETYLGKSVMLNPEEIETMESDPVPNIDLDLLLSQTLGQSNFNYPVTVETTPNNPNIYYQDIVPAYSDEDQELYGFKVQNVVENMF